MILFMEAQINFIIVVRNIEEIDDSCDYLTREKQKNKRENFLLCLFKSGFFCFNKNAYLVSNVNLFTYFVKLINEL